MNRILESLKNKRLVWQGNHTLVPEMAGQTGYPEFDEQLHGGLPEQGIIDLQSATGIGELRLFYPYLQQRHQQEQRLLIYIAPPFVVNAETLAELELPLSRIVIVRPDTEQQALWAAEQCLKSGCCHSVLLWQKQLQVHQVKRLQLAAEAGDALHFLLRPDTQHNQSLPVTLSMQFKPRPRGLKIVINKRKGGWAGQPFEVNMAQRWPELTLPAKDNVLPFPRVSNG